MWDRSMLAFDEMMKGSYAFCIDGPPERGLTGNAVLSFGANRRLYPQL
jgi:hypothetical protein